MPRATISRRVTKETSQTFSVRASCDSRAMHEPFNGVKGIEGVIRGKLADKIKRFPEDKELAQMFKDFERIIKSVPEGYELGIVFSGVSTLTNDERSTARRQFDGSIRPGDKDEIYRATIREDFIRKIGGGKYQVEVETKDKGKVIEERSYASELNKQGVSQYLTDMMSVGVVIRSAIDMTTDHILEMANCETFTNDTEVDPNNKFSNENTFIINHFNNLLLIPEVVHKDKTLLKNIQCRALGEEKGGWFISILPKAVPGQPGMVGHICKEGPYAMKLMTDREAASEVIRYVIGKPNHELKNSDAGKMAMKIINEELNVMLEEAKRDGGGSGSLAGMKKFYKDNQLDAIAVKAKYICGDESVICSTLANFNKFMNGAKAETQTTPTSSLSLESARFFNKQEAAVQPKKPDLPIKRFVVKAQRPA